MHCIFTFVHVLETGFYYIKNRTYFPIKYRLTFKNEMFYILNVVVKNDNVVVFLTRTTCSIYVRRIVTII